MEIGPRHTALTLFLRRLEARSTIAPAEREALLALGGTPQRVGAHRDVIRLGGAVQDACLVAEGLVARFTQLEDGSRQIVSLHLPGDMVDLYALMLPRAPSPLQALTAATVIRVPHDALRRLANAHPGLAAAFWRDCVADSAILAQWLVNIGRKNARARLAHLLCEMAVRFQQAGELRLDAFPLSITQEQIGDALGLTSVHVNRSIKALRDEGLVRITRAGVTILDWPALASLGEFDPGYLHLPPAAGMPGDRDELRHA